MATPQIEISSLTKQWSDAKISSIRQILSSNKINKTGRLSKSLKIKIINDPKNPRLDFYSIFYGKYVRAYYLKTGLDIYGPIANVQDLIRMISTDFKKRIIPEVVKNLQTEANKE